MPLNDWPLTNSFQASTPAWKLTQDQLRAAIDGVDVLVPDIIANWNNVNLATLEAFSGVTTATILRGLVAARDSTDPDSMRSIKCSGGTRFIQVNVLGFEAASGISLLNLWNAINNAVP